MVDKAVEILKKELDNLETSMHSANKNRETHLVIAHNLRQNILGIEQEITQLKEAIRRLEEVS